MEPVAGTCDLEKAIWEMLEWDVAGAFEVEDWGMLLSMVLGQDSVARYDIRLACAARVDVAHERELGIARSPS